MGLLAVIGPSRKLHFGFSAFFARSFSKIRASAQNCRTSCSPPTKFDSDAFSNIYLSYRRSRRGSGCFLIALSGAISMRGILANAPLVQTGRVPWKTSERAAENPRIMPKDSVKEQR